MCQSSPNQIEFPSNGRDIEVKGDQLDEQRRFMPGVQTADHVEDHLDNHGQPTKFAWGVIFLLQGLGVEMDVETQDLVLSNTKQMYECLTKSSSQHE